MKRKRALELQQSWGDRPCEHPGFAKEYDLGVRTGNFICTQCGAILGPVEKTRITAARRDADPPPDPEPATTEHPIPPRAVRDLPHA